MRSKVTGLENHLQACAPHMLDIDGDICHAEQWESVLFPLRFACRKVVLWFAYSFQIQPTFMGRIPRYVFHSQHQILHTRSTSTTQIVVSIWQHCCKSFNDWCPDSIILLVSNSKWTPNRFTRSMWMTLWIICPKIQNKIKIHRVDPEDQRSRTRCQNSGKFSDSVIYFQVVKAYVSIFTETRIEVF